MNGYSARVSPFFNDAGSMKEVASALDETTRSTEISNKTNKLDISTDNMSSLIFPTINSNAVIKSRISTLEETVDNQSQYNKLTLESFNNSFGKMIIFFQIHFYS